MFFNHLKQGRVLQMSKANKYPLDEEQEALLADFICQQVNRAYSIGFLIGFAAALTGAVIYYFFI